MFEHERKLFGLMLRYTRKLTSDLTDEQFSQLPVPTMNPPVWIMGHLATVNDFGLQIAGREFQCPKAWHADFGPNSQPLQYQSGVAPTKAELMTAFERGHADLDAVVSSVPADVLAERQPLDFLRPHVETLGELLSHLMTTHIAIHLGQLSAWRRTMGLPAV